MTAAVLDPIATHTDGGDTIDLWLAFGAVLFAAGLATATVAAWRWWFRRADRREANQATADGDTTQAVDLQACAVPTVGAEWCGLLAGHAGRHISYPSGAVFPPDEPDDEPPTGEVLAVDPPVVARERLYAVGGWIDIAGRKVHRSCADHRRDARHDLVCCVCADRLGMAPAGGVA